MTLLLRDHEGAVVMDTTKGGSKRVRSRLETRFSRFKLIASKLKQTGARGTDVLGHTDGQ